MSRPILPLTVAVCTRNRHRDLAACLESLSRLNSAPEEILVVHNDAGRDGTEELARKSGAVYLREAEPGLDRARNRALAEARADLIAFIDDDARADPGWLDAVHAAFADSKVSCVTGRVLAAEIETEAQRLLEKWKSYDRGPKPRLFNRFSRGFFFPVRSGVMGTGANMACRKSVGLSLGFDPALDVGTPTCGGGDLDFFYRVIRAGGTIAYRPDALVFHRHRRTYAQLKRLRYGYGIAGSAAAWKIWRREQNPAALLFLAYKTVFHTAEILANLTGLRQWPADLSLAELRGMFRGPRALRAGGKP